MENFKIGERVKIKSWEEMEKEFGMDCGDSINCYCGFPRDMKHLCGRIAKIKLIDGKKIELEEWSETTGNMDWGFSTDMIKHMDFLLDDLQFADIVTLRNGERYVIAEGCMCAESSSYYHDCDEVINYYNDDLTQNEGDKNEDIVKVERAGQVIFERKEAIEMTVAEISQKLGYEVKVVKEK